MKTTLLGFAGSPPTYELLQASDLVSVNRVLASQSVTDYLGMLWLRRHPAVIPAVVELESLISSSQHR